MQKNLTQWMSALRLLIGFILTTYLFLGGPLWTAFGLYLLLSGSLQFCFVKKLMTG